MESGLSVLRPVLRLLLQAHVRGEHPEQLLVVEHGVVVLQDPPPGPTPGGKVGFGVPGEVQGLEGELLCHNLLPVDEK